MGGDIGWGWDWKVEKDGGIGWIVEFLGWRVEVEV